jgi:LPS-assembly protein
VPAGKVVALHGHFAIASLLMVCGTALAQPAPVALPAQSPATPVAVVVQANTGGSAGGGSCASDSTVDSAASSGGTAGGIAGGNGTGTNTGNSTGTTVGNSTGSTVGNISGTTAGNSTGTTAGNSTGTTTGSTAGDTVAGATPDAGMNGAPQGIRDGVAGSARAAPSAHDDAAAPAAGGACAAPMVPPPAAPILRVERILGGGRGAGPGTGPVFVKADKVSGEFDEHTNLDGAVEVRRGGVVLRGDRAVYTFETDALAVRGKVRMVERGAAFEGPALDFKLEAHTGQMPNASYTYAAKDGRGQSRLIEFLGDDNIRMHDATYTTCKADDPAWWIKAETLDIHEADQEAVGHSTTLYFEGIPVFSSPYFDLPLGDQRRSGILTPGFYQNSRLGQEFITPVYLNIAPNRDYTLTPDVMPRRGVLMGNELRFLEPNVRGLLNYDIMPNDRTTGTMRDHIRLETQYANYTNGTTVAPQDATMASYGNVSGLNFNLDYNRVSDDNYLIDFSHNIVTASPEVLNQEADLTYGETYWNATLRLAKSQTLISLLAASDSGPYERVPELTVNGNHTDWYGFDATATVDATRFQHPAINALFTPPVANSPIYTQKWFSQDGSRFIVNPSLSYPILHPGWFITPKVQFNFTQYALDPNFNANATSATRSLPIASLDSGLIFERPARWLGDAVHQTLEPRVYYALVPYRNQDRLPNFDSADADFNFAQLFTENAFTGGDRISEDNQITTALVSRVIDDETGAERLRLALGQRYYFGSQRVTLPGEVPRTNLSSDVLFVGSASMGRRWSLDLGLDYSTVSSQLALATIGVRWQPRAASVINFSYRYESTTLAGTFIDQFRASAQWPLTRRWYGVGALDYSIADHGWVESVAGLEYKADCWVGRFVLSRYAVALPNSEAFTNNYTTAWFFQIELNGLTSVGTSPLDQLQRSITGFQRINPLSAPGGPFDNYE